MIQMESDIKTLLAENRELVVKNTILEGKLQHGNEQYNKIGEELKEPFESDMK